MIAYFAVSVSGVIYNLVFVAVMMISIGIQWRWAPFVSDGTNRAEFTLLCAVPIVIVAVIPVIQDFQFAAVMMSVMVLLPIPVMCYYGGSVVAAEWKQFVADHAEHKNDHDLERVASNSVFSTSPTHVEMMSASDLTLETEESDGVENVMDQSLAIFNMKRAARINAAGSDVEDTVFERERVVIRTTADAKLRAEQMVNAVEVELTEEDQSGYGREPPFERTA